MNIINVPKRPLPCLCEHCKHVVSVPEPKCKCFHCIEEKAKCDGKHDGRMEDRHAAD